MKWIFLFQFIMRVEVLIKISIPKIIFTGPIDINLFEFKGQYYISGINPRVGGVYPHAYEMECNFMEYSILLSALKKIGMKVISVVVMKYDDVILKRKKI